MGGNSTDLIMGVEREIVEKFFRLIKEKYPLVDKANYFIERNGGVSGINIGMANQRDFLSHLCTVLVRTDFEPEEKLAQVATAEEHLRRAIIETYQRAVTIQLDKVHKIFETYKKEVIPYQRSKAILASAPNTLMIRAIFDEVEDLRTKGRSVKNENIWNENWERGISFFLDAFEKLKEIEKELEEYILRAHQIKINKKTIFLALWGIVATIVSIVLSIF